MEEFEVIQQLLDKAKPHKLEMECLVTMVSFLVPHLTIEQLQAACDEAFCQWDL